MWLHEHTWLTATCVYVVLVGVVTAVVAHNQIACAAPDYCKMSHKMLVYAIGGMAWPFLWAAICGPSVDHMPAVAYLGLVWPSLLLLVDTAFVSHSFRGDDRGAARSIQNDGNTLSAMALAIGGLFVRYVSEGFATAASPMFVAAVLFVLLVVVPTPAFRAGSTHASAVHAIQKVALQYCLGFIITSVGITFGVGMVHAAKQGTELKKVIGAYSTTKLPT